ncbi:type I methionyl aminopeptidase [Planomonospora sp. ID82291]|uniref:type I methionyl aminopeptidase n=1 Tax=Planomonospora sp. ID82291 TaxID=2738136 RepID=UPI0018C3FEBF|nr:type I methionyl aminopeptidase [Planomonospora sp. ID82291]MBG0816565.1 type I methionyl aminopeptidase [Planomonospora sp. ID82291]
MVEIKTPAEIEAMAEAGKVVAAALAAVGSHAAVGVSLRELDEIARTVIDGSGATSAFLGYRPSFAPTPFPAVICTSVNDAIVHGIPDGYRLRDGDLLSVDCGVLLDGWAGDAAVSLTVGRPRPADLALIATAQAALEAAIALCVPGGRLGDLGHAIARTGRAAGCGTIEEFGGHGIGRAMHEDPHVPNRGRPGRGLTLRPGLVLAIEPMFTAGGADGHVTAADGWTLCSTDGSRAAHVEHTVAVTDDGPRVLTRR